MSKTTLNYDIPDFMGLDDRIKFFSSLNHGLNLVKTRYGARVNVEEYFTPLNNRQNVTLRSNDLETLENSLSAFFEKSGFPSDITSGIRYVKPVLFKYGKKLSFNLWNFLVGYGRQIVDV